MLPHVKTVDFVLRWSCDVSLVRAITLRVIDMKNEQGANFLEKGQLRDSR